MNTPRPLPSRLGKYQVVRLLGEGGMGIVYEGFDPQIRRQVALKAIKRGAVSDEQELLERFQREAEAAGRLLHPRIVTVYEYSEDVTVGAGGREERTPFIAMELVQGRELRRVLEEKARQGQRLPLVQVQQIMSGLLDALAFSHRNHVAHRDIKPANIMVLPDGNIKVTDFSIARLLELRESGALTEHGTVLGTLSYMAPEQLRSDPVDGLTDVYAAGVVLYELLTGTVPFTGTTEGLMYKVLNEKPEPPSKLIADLPRAYDAVIERALAKRPGERFQSAAEFLRALPAPQAALAAADTVLRPAAGGPDPMTPANPDTGSAPVPPEVLALLHNAQPEKRLVAVLRLQELLGSGSAPVVVATWQALERLQNDASPAVAGAATRVLQDAGGGRQTSPGPAASLPDASDWVSSPVRDASSEWTPDWTKPVPPGGLKSRTWIILGALGVAGVVGAVFVVGELLMNPAQTPAAAAVSASSGSNSQLIANSVSQAPSSQGASSPPPSSDEPSPVTNSTAPENPHAPSAAAQTRHAPGRERPRSAPRQMLTASEKLSSATAITPGKQAQLSAAAPPAVSASPQAPPQALRPGPEHGSEQSSSSSSSAMLTVEHAAANAAVPASPQPTPPREAQPAEKLASPPAPAVAGAVSPAAAAQPLKAAPVAFHEPEMVHIAGGSFSIGSPMSEEGRFEDEGPQRTVEVAAFSIGKYPVTFEEWDVCVAEGGCKLRDYPGDSAASDATTALQPGDAGWGRGKRPVINVSWKDAQQYVKWLSHKTGKRYRLPSEAEWEFAARADSATPYYWGDKIGSNHANCVGCGSRWDGRQSSPVDSFGPNPWGLYDMAGNVSQWVQDCYHKSYDEVPPDGKAWEQASCSAYVARGGSWHVDARRIRSAYRAWGLLPHNTIGFRLARTD